MLQPRQIRKLAKGYSDTHIMHTNGHQVISTAGWWGSPWALFFEPVPDRFNLERHLQLPVPPTIIELLSNITTGDLHQLWPTTLTGLPDIAYDGNVLLKFENSQPDLETWIDARYISTILRKTYSRHPALTFHVLQRPPHDNGRTKNVLVAKLLGSPVALLACVEPITDAWDWTLTNKDLPRPYHHIPRPREINLEMASQPGLM